MGDSVAFLIFRDNGFTLCNTPLFESFKASKTLYFVFLFVIITYTPSYVYYVILVEVILSYKSLNVLV